MQSMWVQHYGHSCNGQLLGLAEAGDEAQGGPCRGTGVLLQIPIGTSSLAGVFNGVKLVVETPEETLFSHQGAQVTLPCHYHYEPTLLAPRTVRIKWWKLSENGAPEQDVLVAIGQRHRSFGDYRGRVRLWQNGEREVSLQIRDLRLEDSGRYRCEVIDGLEDQSGLVELELRGEAPCAGGYGGRGLWRERAPRNRVELCASDQHVVLETTPWGRYCYRHPHLITYFF